MISPPSPLWMPGVHDFDDAGDDDWINLVSVAGDVELDLAGDLGLDGAYQRRWMARSSWRWVMAMTTWLEPMVSTPCSVVAATTSSTASRRRRAPWSGWRRRLNGGDGILLGDIGAKISRLYSASLDRNPDQPGYFYWSEELENGAPLTDLATAFINRTSFRRSTATSITPALSPCSIKTFSTASRIPMA